MTDEKIIEKLVDDQQHGWPLCPRCGERIKGVAAAAGLVAVLTAGQRVQIPVHQMEVYHFRLRLDIFQFLHTVSPYFAKVTFVQGLYEVWRWPCPSV